MPLLDLSSPSSAARAGGEGTVGRLRNLRGTGNARGEGAGTIKRVLNLTTVADARADGAAWPSWDAPPRIPPGLQDAWFYGFAKVKDMPGFGAARAGGTGVIS